MSTPSDPGAVDDRPTVLLDARWWHVGGTGTFTRRLFAGLAEVRPDQRWIAWGPRAIPGDTWPGLRHVATETGPSSWFGQRQAFRLPTADLVLHPHQTRPAHRLPAASCILDLIQLQHPNRAVRAAMARRLAATVERAQVLFTIAPSVRDQLVDRYGVDPAAVHVLHLPIDRAAARAIDRRRTAWQAARGPAPRRVLLAVGTFAPHKNHRRLIEAFAATSFAASGGELHLVGGEVAELGLTTARLPRGVRVRGRLDQAVLDDALAGALALVQPSLAEGYGLPVAEALAAGVPVVSSPIPAVAELGPAGVPTFDPTSTSAMAEAIDETVSLVEAGAYWDRVDRDPWLAAQPTDAGLARQVVAGLAPALPGGGLGDPIPSQAPLTGAAR